MFRFLKRIFGKLFRRHPKMADFAHLNEAEKERLLEHEAVEFAKRYGGVIKTLANE